MKMFFLVDLLIGFWGPPGAHVLYSKYCCPRASDNSWCLRAFPICQALFQALSYFKSECNIFFTLIRNVNVPEWKNKMLWKILFNRIYPVNAVSNIFSLRFYWDSGRTALYKFKVYSIMIWLTYILKWLLQ